MQGAGFLIRKMTEKDLDEILLIESVSFSLPWSRESYQSELKNELATYLIAERQGEVAGYLGIWVVFEEAFLTNVAVAPSFRSRGLGKALMQEGERVARQGGAHYILLEDRPSNLRALTMYRSLGYEARGLRKGYYSDNNEDAIIMCKHLNEK